ncbi:MULTISPECIES: YlbF family regulator [Alteribacter]|uniref:YlbF family regulator n=1 Tax=Alteribacter keqinensis TaxID=2483800 RepID=A0A3M7TWR4_9BACI|nr:MULTISPECIES: YlbF family regulator [Alteribacter]MBM7095890.1 YlbF family regulator [Alteribacter salitolerans]RNA69711.1 YlbF family regulator [Alteribacter keqinensis]
MITTATSADVLHSAYDLGDFVTSSEVYVDYIDAKKRMDKDKEAARLVSEFLKLKEDYDEVQRFGKYHPDYKRVTKEVREAKRMVDLHDSIAEYKKAEKELESMLRDVSLIIADTVSKSVKVPTGNPFFDQDGCSGGCGSGGSCGCS